MFPFMLPLTKLTGRFTEEKNSEDPLTEVPLNSYAIEQCSVTSPREEAGAPNQNFPRIRAFYSEILCHSRAVKSFISVNV